MSRPTLIIAIMAAVGMSIAATAHADTLGASEIKALISGKRVYLSTPYGVELPLHYKSGGRVNGDVTGISLASMFAPKETGSWWVKGKQLCQKWPSWYDGKTFCFTITQTGANSIAWKRNDGLSGTARIGG